jgi:hypothetical protein
MVSVGAVQKNWLFAAWCTTILAVGISGSISESNRARGIKQFAVTHNLRYTRSELPNGLNVGRTFFNSKQCFIGNCLQGMLDGIPLAIFDLSYRVAKGSTSQTIVAFPRTGLHAIPEPPIDAVGSYQFEEAGDWIIAWIPRRIVKVEELEDWCIEMHALAHDLLAEERGEAEARPHLFRWMT